MLRALSLACALTLTSYQAFALPDDFVAQYRVLEDVGTSNEKIVWVYEVTFSATSETQTTVTWEPDKMRIIEVDGHQNGDVIWVDGSPAFTSSSDVTITHADPANPTISEFKTIPQIEGVATGTTNSTEDNEYEFEAKDVECDSSCQVLFTVPTAIQIYMLIDAYEYYLWWERTALEPDGYVSMY